MSTVPTTTMRIEPALKEQAKPILEGIGLNLSSSINLFLKAVVRTGGIPFQLRVDEETPRIAQQRRDAELFEFARTNSMAASMAHDRFHEVGNVLVGLLFAEESKAGQREDRDLEEALRTERRSVEQAVADYDYDYDLMLPTLTRWRIRCDELAGRYGS